MLSPGKYFRRPYYENTQHRKELVECFQVVECLPNKGEALSSKSSTGKKCERKTIERGE
jgi:hypothetical protein